LWPKIPQLLQLTSPLAFERLVLFLRLFMGGLMNLREVCAGILFGTAITFASLVFYADDVRAAAVTIVALGSSNTVGLGVGSPNAYPKQIEAMLRAKGIDAHVTIRAVPGQSTAAMLRDAESVPTGTTLVTFEPNYPNDVKAGIASQNKANLAQIAAGLRARGIKSVLIKIKGMPASEFQPDGEHLTAHGHQVLAARYLPEIIAAIRE
jgi:acyl-CoA thioesterase I